MHLFDRRLRRRRRVVKVGICRNSILLSASHRAFQAYRFVRGSPAAPRFASISALETDVREPRTSGILRRGTGWHKPTDLFEGALALVRTERFVVARPLQQSSKERRVVR